ncbi:endonuclease/exonuclease/phosphatase family protein [Aliifodinibius sp. S!AR15-10]|uniref:endonuclease/exonuclease/phosphatase family protein n=1 Tax=Aliifodinibius sp. S!AR15-10 TaxID=2950437 RepID=UPI002857496D|nr:endonuclease/exonuclease/phosphatase family protein [Aliifodinibius sp. S!AR15-10]MDR8391735.1 endonuclease/exonuclease/phosphatase family protein [Aliifodinibius sp. S!AR15-10]
MACGEMSGQQEKEVHLRVAAYNVEVGSNATAQEIGEALLPYDLDIVCFSEAPGGGSTEDVAKVLGLSHIVVGRYTTAGHQDKYKSIASRTPLYDYEEILMTDTLHTVTKARTAINDKEITIYSVHFPFGWRDAEHIRETTAKLAHFAYYLREKQDVETSILLGDFNFIPSNDNYISNDYEMFADAGFVPSWNDLGTDITKLNTHNAFDSTDIGSGKVIDHILYNPSKVKALDGSIIEMERPLSDHKPVWALLQVN